MSRIDIPGVDNTVLFLCDIQEKFRNLIPNMKRMIVSSKLLLDTCMELNIPVIVTEQYPKVFGKTVKELQLNDDHSNYSVYSKTRFSMFIPDVKQKLDSIFGSSTDESKSNNNGNSDNKDKHVVISGLEGHICILQTCLDLLKNGYNVHLIVDGVGSQRKLDLDVALQRLNVSGVNLTTSESVVFQLLKDSKNSKFKAVSKYVKQHISDVKQINKSVS